MPASSTTRWRGGLTPARRATILLVASLALLAVWQLTWDRTDFLPSPRATVEVIIDLLGQPSTYADLAATARRLVMGLTIGYGAAVVVALLMQISPWWSRFFRPYIFITLTTPSLVISLLSLMVFGLSEIGVYLAVAIVVFPFVVVGLDEGIAALDPRLSEMTFAYRFALWSRVRHQILPSMAPMLFAAFRNVHALGWKVVVIAELFSQQTGLGVEYKRAYGFFELDRLVAWTFFFIVMVVGVEYGILRPIERRVFRWRPDRAVTMAASAEQHGALSAQAD